MRRSRVFRALLKFSLIETSTVGTAAQALSLIQTERFDLYLLDTSLPDLDGFELCRRMRARDPHTPVLFYSGAAYDSDKKRGIEAGAIAYLTKPDAMACLGRVFGTCFRRSLRRRLDYQCGQEECCQGRHTFSVPGNRQQLGRHPVEWSGSRQMLVSNWQDLTLMS